MKKGIFGLLLASILIILSGCSDSSQDVSDGGTNSETMMDDHRSGGPACLVSYGFADKYDCYEGDVQWIDMNCNMLGNVAAKEGGSVEKYPDQGCPKLSNFAGCCNDGGRVQCYYLDTLYQAEPRKSEQMQWLTRTCREAGGVWESE